MSTWISLLDRHGPILADGAMGTLLMGMGLGTGSSPLLWNVEHPEKVREAHQAYLAAGAQVLLTNTFGGNPFRLGVHRLQARLSELNRAAVRIAREAVAASGRDAAIAGDIGPTGELLAPLGDIDPAQARAAYAQQAGALIEAGVDLIWLETFSSLEEIRAAFEGVRQVSIGIPIVATMTFDTGGRTMMGVAPEQAARTLPEWGAAAVGANCGNGPGEILAVVEKMHAAAPESVLVAKANAGVPTLRQGIAVYPAGPDEMAQYAIAAAKAGARVIGACCGSTPRHVQAMGAALASGAEEKLDG